MNTLIISAEGVYVSDLKADVREVLRLLEGGFTSGHNSNDTRRFRFRVGSAPEEAASAETVSFVAVSSLVPAAWREWFFDAMSVGAPFTWGDNNRSLVTASRFLEHAEHVIDLERNGGALEAGETESEEFISRLLAMGETYIDLEN